MSDSQKGNYAAYDYTADVKGGFDFLKGNADKATEIPGKEILWHDRQPAVNKKGDTNHEQQCSCHKIYHLKRQGFRPEFEQKGSEVKSKAEQKPYHEGYNVILFELSGQ